ncbi:MAG: folylpolyglutamate synthase/dihydrofolate synthase family protein [Chitinophagaceae bacterium]
MPQKIAGSYSDTLQFLYEQLPMFSRIGAAAVKKDLTNTLALCKVLNNPQDSIKTIHIAGTNGKGSVSHMLATIFQKAGFKTGLYTSPHLVDFRERVRIDGKTISEEFVVEFISKNKAAIAQIKPSFFEITVAMAFDSFAKEKVDIAIIETGLGGRLDSTNVIKPELSIITNISLDHTEMLGDTIVAIAREKAGIIKPKTPVVVGDCKQDALNVFIATALRQDSDLREATKTWSVEKNPSGKVSQFTYSAIEISSQKVFQIGSDLGGNYQSGNIATVLTAISILQKIGWNLPAQQAIDSLENVQETSGIRGRWETISEAPLIIADVAHNPAGIEEVMGQWSALPHSKKHIIVGFVKDKDVRSALALFPKDARYHFCAANIPRALPVRDLANIASELGLHGIEHSSVKDAVLSTRKDMQNEDALLITGSFFIVGEALTALEG